MDPPVEGGCGSLCWEWSFRQRVGDEGPGWDPAFSEQGEVSGQPDDGGVVVEALTEGPQLRDVHAGHRGEEFPVELDLVVPRCSGLRPSSGGVAVLGVDLRGGSPHSHVADQGDCPINLVSGGF